MDLAPVTSSAPDRSPAPPFVLMPGVDQAQQPALRPLSPRAQIRQSYVAGIRPDTRLLVSEWADQHRILPKKSSAEPGPWRTRRVPFLREIMDCMSATSEVTDVVFVKANQIAGTEALLNALGYWIDHAPGPVMLVQPTVDMAKRFSRQRLDPLLIDTPNLARKVAESRERDSGNTMLSKDFPGGQLVLTGANSAVGLRSMPAQYLLMDEIDEFPADVDEEGSPIDLAEARQDTFARRKRMKVSTPTIEGRSAILAAYAESDQRRYYVPCPSCGEMQALEWKQLTWTKLLLPPERAVYECCACGYAIQHHQKTAMLEAGEWRTRRSVLLREAAAVLARVDGGVHDPEARAEYAALIAEAGDAEPAGGKIRGYHLNALYSPAGWVSWGELASKFEKVYKDPAKYRVFVNTKLAEAWSSKGGDAPAWDGLYKRRESYAIGTIPMGVLLLTAGVDVQKDRLVYEVVGWGRGKRSWSIDSGVLPGDTADIDRGPWGQLDTLLARSYPHAGGVEMPIRMMAVDAGYNQSIVCNWVRLHQTSRVIAVKGRDEAPMLVGSPVAVDVNDRGRKLKRGGKIWPVGSSMAKSEFYGWLRLDVSPDPRVGAPSGYCHFPEYGDEYFKQITAEQFVAHKTRKGYIQMVWEMIPGRENHGLDARIYARAAAFIAGLDRFQENDWAARERMVDTGPAPALQLVSVGVPAAPAVAAAAARRRVHRSRYLGGGE